jgi:hypothetical protein
LDAIARGVPPVKEDGYAGGKSAVAEAVAKIRPPDRTAVATFANAAAGSLKNITPKRLITTSNEPGSNG